MEGYKIPWTRTGLGQPLSSKDIENLQIKLANLAKKTGNVISTYLMPMEVKWVQKNLTNGHLHVVSRGIDGTGEDWVVIGIDKETVDDYVSRI